MAQLVPFLVVDDPLVEAGLGRLVLLQHSHRLADLLLSDRRFTIQHPGQTLAAGAFICCQVKLFFYQIPSHFPFRVPVHILINLVLSFLGSISSGSSSMGGGWVCFCGADGVLHQHIPALVVDVILLRGVDVLHIALVIDEVRDGADEVLAGVEDLQHRPSVFAESQPIVKLHLSRQTGVVAGHPVQEIRALFLHVRDALAPALVEDGRVGHAQDDPAFQQRVVLLRFPDHPCLFHRVLSQALVGCAGAAVKLLDPVEPPALVRCIPPHRKRLRETEVVSPPDLPVLRDGERFDDVGPALVLVVVRVVPPLGEHLPRKAVPVSVEQRLLLGLRQRGQRADVARVVFQQRRVVKDGGRDKNAGAPPGDFLPVRRFYLHQLYHPRPGRCRTDEPCLHPAMPPRRRG